MGREEGGRERVRGGGEGSLAILPVRSTQRFIRGAHGCRVRQAKRLWRARENTQSIKARTHVHEVADDLAGDVSADAVEVDVAVARRPDYGTVTGWSHAVANCRSRE